MRIFHIATAADWADAQASGSYTTSTYGRSLAEEGFLHASRGDQWQGVRERFYADVTEPLVLLVIDTDLVGSPVVEEVPPGAQETYPHIYGPLEPSAVVQVIPLDSAGADRGEKGLSEQASFSTLFLGEMFHNVRTLLALLAMVVVGAGIGEASGNDWGPALGTLIGLVAGFPLARMVHRRRG